MSKYIDHGRTFSDTHKSNLLKKMLGFAAGVRLNIFVFLKNSFLEYVDVDVDVCIHVYLFLPQTRVALGVLAASVENFPFETKICARELASAASRCFPLPPVN